MFSRKEVNSPRKNIKNLIIIYFLCCVLFFCFSCNIVNAANTHTTADNSNSASTFFISATTSLKISSYCILSPYFKEDGKSLKVLF